MPELLATIHDAREPGVNGRRMLAVLDEDKLRRVLAGCSTRTSSLVPTGCAPCPGCTPNIPSRLTSTDSPTRCVTCPASPTAGCSAAIRTGAVRCGSPSTTCSCAGCCTNTSTTAIPSRSSARPARDGSARCSRSPRSSAGGWCQRFCRVTAAVVLCHGAIERFRRRSVVEGPRPVLRVLPRRHRRRPRRQPPDRMDRPCRQDHPGPRLPQARGLAVQRRSRATSSTAPPPRAAGDRSACSALRALYCRQCQRSRSATCRRTFIGRIRCERRLPG